MSADETQEPPTISLDAYRIQRGRYCGHRGMRVINPEARSLTCGQCKATLDLFDCLEELARDRDNIVYQKAEAKKEIKRLEQRVAELRADEANARARLKRLSFKLSKAGLP